MGIYYFTSNSDVIYLDIVGEGISTRIEVSSFEQMIEEIGGIDGVISWDRDVGHEDHGDLYFDGVKWPTEREIGGKIFMREKNHVNTITYEWIILEEIWRRI